ncbi:MAG: LysR family transcriptional regulator, partial [Acidimicrobiia bacterium]|nr:LysR family transcriptional regulator [Acidimicrobiia bacterium]
MELKHLEALIAVSQEGSFTAAADRLSTVQSNISEQIRQLEVELGTELIVRSRQGASLTEAGRAVLARASRIKHEASEIASDVAGVFGLKIGNASFGVVGTASKWLVPDLVSAMQRSAPDVMLRINEGASERLVAEVLDLQL